MTLLGRLQMMNHDIPMAKKAYIKALDLAPDSVEAKINYATVLLSTEEYKEAEKILKLAVMSDPPSQGKAFPRSALYYLEHMRTHTKSLTASIKPTRAYHRHIFHSMTLAKLGAPDVAKKALSRYIEMQPNGMYLIDAERALSSLE
jgi:tetratricopeptide (TPR) repeat protein